MPRVSVIMPAWNRASYVEQAARSVLAQTAADLELLAVDDGSTDETAAILERLAARDARLRVVRAGHGGQTAALNAGLALARGERLAFHDSDDVWRPRLLERLGAALDAAPPAVAFAYGRYRYFADGNDPEDRAKWLRYRARCREGAVLRALVRSNFVARIVVLVRREAFERAGLRFDGAVGFATDWDLFLRLARAGEVRHVPEVLALARMHGGNMSHDLVAHHRSYVAVLEAARARCASPREAASLGLPRAIARQRHGLARRLLQRGEVADARQEALRGVAEAPPLERGFGLALLAATAVPLGARLFGRAQEAALRARGGLSWGAAPA
jgi:glycosyltransferase involved in cell wall biosynthesis